MSAVPGRCRERSWPHSGISTEGSRTRRWPLRPACEIEPNPQSLGLALLRDADLRTGQRRAARARYATGVPGVAGRDAARSTDELPGGHRSRARAAEVAASVSEPRQLLDSSEACHSHDSAMGMSGYWSHGRADPRPARPKARSSRGVTRSRAGRLARLLALLSRLRSQSRVDQRRPEFKAVFADIERDMARQRAELAARPEGRAARSGDWQLSLRPEVAIRDGLQRVVIPR